MQNHDNAGGDPISKPRPRAVSDRRRAAVPTRHGRVFLSIADDLAPAKAHGGRPKRDLSAELARAIFVLHSEEIYRPMLKALLNSNAKVFAVLADRAFGKVSPNLVDSQGPDRNELKLVGQVVSRCSIFVTK